MGIFLSIALSHQTLVDRGEASVGDRAGWGEGLGGQKSIFSYLFKKIPVSMQQV